MKVILTKDIDNLGQKGDLLDVKPGFGRNFLIPRGMAVVANSSNVRRYEEETRQQSRKLEQIRKDAEAIAKRLSETEITIAKPVGEEERLFGTVTTQDIVEALQGQQFDIDRRKVTLDQEIRTLGTYTATVRVHAEHDVQVTVKVVPESETESA